MIQDIAPKKFFNQYKPEARVKESDFVISFFDNKVCCKHESQLSFPTAGQIGLEKAYTYLFSIDERVYFLLMGEELKLASYDYMDVRELRELGVGPQYEDMALYTAKHLADWYRDSQYCGRCGHKLIHSSTERAMTCLQCKNTIYPRIMPAVIVGVICGESILLTRYRIGYAHNALVAGFTEIGETLEETVAREVMEETGLKVKNIRYYKSQPWGIANDILMGFYCDVDGDTTISRDEEELRSAKWVAREDIVLQPNNYSLTNEMMAMFKEGKIS